MQNILITSGTTSLALRLKNILSDKYNVILSTSAEIPSVMKNHYLQLPNDSSPIFVHELLKLALSNNIIYVLPLIGSEILILSQNKVLFEEYNIKLLIPNNSLMDTLDTISTVDKSMELALLDNGTDLITGNKTSIQIDGLGLISDSGDEFILIAQ